MKTFIRNNRNLITYFLIGASAALVDIFFFFYFYRSLEIRSSIATAISMFISMCYGFTMNIFFNFNVFDRIIPRFISYAAVSFIGMLISSGSLLLFSEHLKMNGGIVKIATLPFIFLVQYLLNKHFSFSNFLSRKEVTLNESYL